MQTNEMVVPIQTISFHHRGDHNKKKRPRVVAEEMDESTFQALFAEQTVREMQAIVHWWQQEERDEADSPSNNALATYYDDDDDDEERDDTEQKLFAMGDGETSVSSFTTTNRRHRDEHDASSLLKSFGKKVPVVLSNGAICNEDSLQISRFRKFQCHVRFQLWNFLTIGFVKCCERFFPSPFFFFKILTLYCHSTPETLLYFAFLLLFTIGLGILAAGLSCYVEWVRIRTYALHDISIWGDYLVCMRNIDHFDEL